MDAFRKQLDALMGANRNGDVEEVKRNYWDRDVCRNHLSGLCPHELFQLTKMDLGVCPKLHSLHLRREYEEAFAKGTDSYERELEECLDKHILECDRKIQRALKRLEDDNAEGAVAIAVSTVTKSVESDEISAEIAAKLKEAEELEMVGQTDDKIRLMDVVEELRQKRADVQALSLLEAFNKDRLLPPSIAPPPPPLHPPDARTQEMIKEKLKRAEELGEEGLVDEAQKAMEEAEALKKLGSRPDINPLPPPPSGSMQVLTAQADQKLRVCDICGAFLSIYDSDRRLADHFGGKLHLGYMAIRQKQAELKERKGSFVRKMGGEDRGVEASRESREKSRERDRSKERDRDRGHKERGGDKEREGNRDRDRDRRESGGDRDRDGGRHRDRDRDSERRRERDGGRDRDSRRDRDDRGRRDRY